VLASDMGNDGSDTKPVKKLDMECLRVTTLLAWSTRVYDVQNIL
jgi:hypothetical protein